MTLSSVIVFILCCVIVYIIGNSFFKITAKAVNKLKSKRKKADSPAASSDSVKVGDSIESNC